MKWKKRQKNSKRCWGCAQLIHRLLSKPNTQSRGKSENYWPSPRKEEDVPTPNTKNLTRHYTLSTNFSCPKSQTVSFEIKEKEHLIQRRTLLEEVYWAQAVKKKKKTMMMLATNTAHFQCKSVSSTTNVERQQQLQQLKLSKITFKEASLGWNNSSPFLIFSAI